MKNSADLEGCYPPQPLASVDDTHLDLQNSSYPIQSHSIIAKYLTKVRKATLPNNKSNMIVTCYIIYFKTSVEFQHIQQLLKRMTKF